MRQCCGNVNWWLGGVWQSFVRYIYTLSHQKYW